MSNTIWTPRISHDAKPIYRAIADALERDLASGVLREGERLPTHRDLADRLDLTPLTVTRAYQEAARRGLIESTVGRGTFVRTAASALIDPALAKGPFSSVRQLEEGIIDLSKNIVAGTDALDLEPRGFAAIRSVIRDADYQPLAGALRHRMAAAAWLKRSGLETTPERVVITPGAQQAIVAILAAVARPGDVVGAEECTYPRFGSIAGLLHLDAPAIPLDDNGVIPKELEKFCKRHSPKAIYIVPNFQNPTGSVMPERRRREIASICKRHGVLIVEDDVYGFLLADPPPPIAAFAPEITCFLTSMSKSTTPSLRIGFASMPESLVDRVTSACGAMTAFTSSAAAEIFTLLSESGAAQETIAAKRALVARNRRAAERALGDRAIRAHEMSPHLWLKLPRTEDAYELAERTRARGIAIAPASWFALDRASAPNAVRISIGAMTDTAQLETALRTLAGIMGDARLGTATVV